MERKTLFQILGFGKYKKLDHFNKSQIHFNSKKQIELVEKCKNGTITLEESKKLIKSIFNLYFVLNGDEKDLPLPTLEIKPIEHDDEITITHATYNHDNIITINENYYLHDGKPLTIDNLYKLIVSIGHELTHYKQNSKVKNFDKLSKAEQEEILTDGSNVYASYKNSFGYLSEEDIKFLYDNFAPSMLIPEKYGNEKNFLKSMTYAAYLDVQYEQHARIQGIEFLKKFINIYRKINFNFFDTIDAIEKFVEANLDELDCQIEMLEFSGNLHSIFENTSNSIIKKLKLLESDVSFKSDNYIIPLKYLLKNKPLNEKIELLKGAVLNNIASLGNVIVDLIKQDPEYEKNKIKIDNELTEIFSTGILDKSKPDVILTSEAYNFASSMNLFDLVSEENYSKIIESLGKQNKLKLLINISKKTNNKNLLNQYYQTMFQLYQFRFKFLKENKLIADDFISFYNFFVIEFNDFYKTHPEFKKTQLEPIDDKSEFYDKYSKLLHLDESKKRYESIYGKHQVEFEDKYNSESIVRNIKWLFFIKDYSVESVLEIYSESKYDEYRDLINNTINECKKILTEKNFKNYEYLNKTIDVNNDDEYMHFVQEYVSFTKTYYSKKNISDELKEMKKIFDSKSFSYSMKRNLHLQSTSNYYKYYTKNVDILDLLNCIDKSSDLDVYVQLLSKNEYLFNDLLHVVSFGHINTKYGYSILTEKQKKLINEFLSEITSKFNFSKIDEKSSTNNPNINEEIRQMQ